MLIAIEAERANIDNPTGVEHYAKQLILALAEIDRENKYILYLRTAPKSWIFNLPKNFEHKVMPFPVAWTQLRLSWEILWHRPDALFIPASALPLIHPKNSVVTVHDLGWTRFPETFGKWQLFTLKLFTWFARKFSSRIIAIAEQTKKDLIEMYDLPAQKITVVYHGFDIENENIKSDPIEQNKLNALPQKFILYLGTLQPRKNPQGLIDAFVDLKINHNISDYSLVIAGGKGWLYQEILDKIEKYKKHGIIYFGYVQDRLALLKKAAMLVHPSFFEGWGLQIFDAFAMDVPVASSNAPALPEVGGDAVEYFDPNNKEQIGQAILKIINDQNLRRQLISRGSERIKQFTWKKCAEQTLNVIKSGQRQK